VHHAAGQRHRALEGLAVALVQRDFQAGFAQGEKDGVDSDERLGKFQDEGSKIGVLGKMPL